MAQSQVRTTDDIVPTVNRSLGRGTLELLEKNNVLNIREVFAELPMPNSILKSVFDRDYSEIAPMTVGRVILSGRFDKPDQSPPARN